MTTFVYILEGENGRVKIGCSSYPAARSLKMREHLDALRHAKHPEPAQ